MQLNSTQEKSLFNTASVTGRSRSPKCPNDEQKCEASPRVQPNSSFKNSFSRGRSRSPESHRNITSLLTALDIDAEHNSPIYGPTESFAPLATSSSLDEQVVIKEQFCTDTVKLATCRTETSTVMPLLCPFQCGIVFKTQTDQRQHLMKEHSCTDKEKNDFFDEREAEEKKNIRKTYSLNTQGLTLYKFRKLLRENNLHEVFVRGNGYCFLSCIIITLAEHGINKTLEILSTEVMTHIMENKDYFYSSFEEVSKLEDEKENLIECCARYFQGANYNTDSVDVCIAAIVKTLGVNLNLFQKGPRTKLITLTKYDCNEYKSMVNLFLHYYPGSKQGRHLDAHYNCYVNSQYYKQNAAAISSRMVKTIEEEEAEKSLKKPNKGNTAAKSSTIVQPVMEPHRDEAETSLQKQNKSDTSSSGTRKLRSSSTQVAQDEKS